MLLVVVAVVVLAVGGFVAGRLTAPATRSAVGPSPVATPVPTTGTTLSGPPAVSARARSSGGPSRSGASAVGVTPSGDTYLSAIKPVHTNYADGFTTGPEQIGTTGYPQSVRFFKDGSTTQLGPPVNDAVGQPQQVHLDVDGSARLEIACSVTNNSTHGFVSMDIVLGNGMLSVGGP